MLSRTDPVATVSRGYSLTLELKSLIPGPSPESSRLTNVFQELSRPDEGSWLHRGDDRLERGADRGTEKADDSDDDCSDQGDHQAVLNSGGALLLLGKKCGLEPGNITKHVSPLSRVFGCARS